jgi:hypothetical protein
MDNNKGKCRPCYLIALVIVYLSSIAGYAYLDSNYFNGHSEFVVQADGDKDKDGVVDKKDNCPDTYNPDQHDSNKDGIGDVCDPESFTAGFLFLD